MRLKPSHKKRLLAVLGNRYTLLSAAFLLWMTFLDANSWRTQGALDEVIHRLQAEKAYYQKQIQADRKSLEALKDPKRMERLAREKYYMSKSDERIFIVKRR